jgi:hypothetical protein
LLGVSVGEHLNHSLTVWMTQINLIHFDVHDHFLPTFLSKYTAKEMAHTNYCNVAFLRHEMFATVFPQLSFQAKKGLFPKHNLELPTVPIDLAYFR